jgi:hypothetical protein
MLLACLSPLNYRHLVSFLFGPFCLLRQGDLWQCTGKFMGNEITCVSVEGESRTIDRTSWIGASIEYLFPVLMRQLLKLIFVAGSPIRNLQAFCIERNIIIRFMRHRL